MTGDETPNVVLKRMLELPPKKIPPLKKILKFLRLIKRLQNLSKKENFKPEIKSMIENLQDELYQLENKQGKGAKLRANNRYELEGEKCSKTLFKVLERQNMQIKQYLNHILMIIKQNILAILRTILNLQKNLWKTLHQANFHSFYY